MEYFQSAGSFLNSSLLNLREQCLHELGFSDVFSIIKREENATALLGLPALLKSLNELKGEELVQTLLDNVLAGNMFDW
jgi:bifunctional damage-control phosphatase, subfamily II, fusion protein